MTRSNHQSSQYLQLAQRCPMATCVSGDWRWYCYWWFTE